MVTDEDRDKYGVNRIVDFYKRQPLEYADYFQAAWRYRHRACAAPARRDAGRCREGREDQRQISRQDLDDADGARRDRRADRRAAGALEDLPPPVDHKEPDSLRAAVGFMRDFVTGLRPQVAMSFDNLPARGIAAGSQSLVLWKDRQFAEHRTTYRWQCAAARHVRVRGFRPAACWFPETQEAQAQYDASFTRFCALFPDTFYVSERGRVFLTNPREIASDAEGHRLLSAGFHSQMGYFRDDAPLYDLVLDREQQRQLDACGGSSTSSRSRPIRQFKQFIWFERAEPPSFMAAAQFNRFRSEDDDVTSEAKITQLAQVYLAKAREMTNDVALGVVRDYFERMNANVRALEQAKAAAEPSHLECAARVRRNEPTAGR